MKQRPATTTIVVHGSWSRPNVDVGVDDIRQWHLDRGFSDIGYHFVIRRDGTIETGRPMGVIGAHAKGFNATSIGICLVGGRPGRSHPLEYSDDPFAWDFNYTSIQMASLMILIAEIQETYPDIEKLLGHRDFPGVKKQCPGFDVKEWFAHVF